MTDVEQIITSFKPHPKYHPTTYVTFLVQGAVPFTAPDMQLLWEEWRQIPGRTYQGPWESERPKFAHVFNDFYNLAASGKQATLNVIYPDGRELVWTPEGSYEARSERGPRLQGFTRGQFKADMGMTICAQFAHTDAPELHQLPYHARSFQGAPTTNPGPGGSVSSNPAPRQHLLQRIARAVCDKEMPPTHVLTDRPIPVGTVYRLWQYYYHQTPALSGKYGAGERVVLTADEVRLYSAGKFDEFFDYFARQDAQSPPEQVLLMAFLYDEFQYVIARTDGRIYLDVLDPTPGTNYLMSKAPRDKRMLIKAFYREL